MGEPCQSATAANGLPNIKPENAPSLSVRFGLDKPATGFDVAETEALLDVRLKNVLRRLRMNHNRRRCLSFVLSRRVIMEMMQNEPTGERTQ
jgi:hypothetical protein